MGRSHSGMRARIPLTYGLPQADAASKMEGVVLSGCVSGLCGKRRRGMSDGPDESERFAGDGGDGDLLELAAADQMAVAARQAMTGLVGDLLNRSRQSGGGRLACRGGRPL